MKRIMMMLMAVLAVVGLSFGAAGATSGNLRYSTGYQNECLYQSSATSGDRGIFLAHAKYWNCVWSSDQEIWVSTFDVQNGATHYAKLPPIGSQISGEISMTVFCTPGHKLVVDAYLAFYTADGRLINSTPASEAKIICPTGHVGSNFTTWK